MTVRHIFDADHRLVAMQLPRYVYRFMRDSEYALASILEPYLWFSHLDTFNDPVEVANRFRLDISFDEWRRYVMLYGGELAEMMPWHKFAAVPEMREVARSLWVQSMSALRKVKLDEVSVCCCSDALDNQLMWGHYADGHRGLCVVLETEKLVGTTVGLIQVRYVDDVVTWDHAAERLRLRETDEFNMRFDQAAFGTKPADWAYEREHRLIAHQRGRMSIPDDAVAGVVLGARMPPERVTAISDAVRQRYRGNPIVPIIRAPLDEATGHLWPTGFVNIVLSGKASFNFLPSDNKSAQIAKITSLMEEGARGDGAQSDGGSQLR